MKNWHQYTAASALACNPFITGVDLTHVKLDITIAWKKQLLRVIFN
jgi:hypothetical protein